MARVRLVPLLLAPSLLLEACGGPAPPAVVETPTEGAPVHLPIDAPEGLAAAIGEAVELEARDLVLRLDGVEVRVPYLSGRLTPVGGGQVVDLEAPESFEVTVDALEVRIPDQSLQRAMGSGRDGSTPFRDLTVRTEGESVLVDGHRGRLPFAFRVAPRVTEAGELALDLEKARLLGIGVKGFLDTFQGPIEKAVNKGGRILDIRHDTLVIDPFPFAGPPEVHAAFTSVEVRDHDIVARLGEITPDAEREEPGGLTLRGGVIRTQKTVLFDATLHLVAQDGGALVIDPDRLSDQLAGGLVKTSRDGDLTVFVIAPDQPPASATHTPSGGPEEPRQAPEPPAPTRSMP